MNRKIKQKMYIQRTALSIVYILVLASNHFGQNVTSTNYARGGAEYLKLPTHAHTSALGSAVTAWRDGLVGLQYNPAILENTKKYYTTATTSYWPDPRTLSAFDVTGSIGEYIVIGGSVVNAGVNSIERRNEFGTLEGYFSDKEVSTSIAVAGRVQWNIAWGIRTRYLFHKLDNHVGNGCGMDCGVTFQPDSGLCLGLSVLNGASWIWWSTGHVDKVFMQLRGGVVKKLLNGSLVFSCDIAKTLKQPIDIALGTEYSVMNFFTVAGGVLSSFSTKKSKNYFREPELSVGFGFHISSVGFDYACTTITRDIGTTHRLSIVLEQ